MGVNKKPDSCIYPEEEQSLLSKLGAIFTLLVILSICILAIYLICLEQEKFDNFIGRKVLIKYNQIEGTIVESPYRFLNGSYWGIEYIDKVGNKQYAYCLNDEIELQEKE